MKEIARISALLAYTAFILLGIISIFTMPTLAVVRVFMVGITLHKLAGLAYAVMEQQDQKEEFNELMKNIIEQEQKEKIHALRPDSK